MKIKIDEEIVVRKNEDRMEIEPGQVEPDGEHVQQAENELTEVLFVC